MEPEGFSFGPRPPDGEPPDPVSPHVWLFLATLSGIVVSALVAAFKSLPDDQPVEWSVFKSQLFRPGTFVAMCMSPIVFFAVLVALNAQSLSFLSMLSAFQNGFFWEQIVASRRRVAGV